MVPANKQTNPDRLKGYERSEPTQNPNPDRPTLEPYQKNPDFFKDYKENDIPYTVEVSVDTDRGILNRSISDKLKNVYKKGFADKKPTDAVKNIFY